MTLALCALFLSLALFWLSTRQWPTLVRLAIWGVGVGGLIAAATLLLAAPSHFGFFRAVADALAHWDNIGESVLAQAFDRNFRSVAGFVLQLLDVFVVVGAVLGLAALWALTPGDRFERALRPTIFVAVGFIIGALTALSVAAVGFGGQLRPRAYVGELTELDIHDGDTFWIGEAPLRLWGVDAPELNQMCRGVADCGTQSRDELAKIVHGAIVQCKVHQNPRGRLTESFGRPLVMCEVRRQGAPPFDLATELIRRGFAVPYKADTLYGHDDAAEEGQGEGVMRGCSLRPDIWRSRNAAHREARAALARGDPIPDGIPTMGACSRASTSP